MHRPVATASGKHRCVGARAPGGLLEGQRRGGRKRGKAVPPLASPPKAAQDVISKSNPEASIRTLAPLYLLSLGTRGLVVAGK